MRNLQARVDLGRIDGIFDLSAFLTLFQVLVVYVGLQCLEIAGSFLCRPARAETTMVWLRKYSGASKR